MTQEISKHDIIRGLHKLGIREGCNLMVHSSLKSFGIVTGGALSLIEALLEVITDSGNLMMPSFNHGKCFNDDNSVFEVVATPTVNGIVADTFWRLPGVRRSLNPTHSFAVWGKNARQYTEFHHRTLTMGAESPLGQLACDGGYCLLVGVGYNVNTFHHVVETSLQVPCLGKRLEKYPVLLANGKKVWARTWGWREKSCPLNDKVAHYSRLLEEKNLVKKMQVGKSLFRLFAYDDCKKVVEEVLANGIDGLPGCSQCKIRPRVVAQTTVSDWDVREGALKADSKALDY